LVQQKYQEEKACDKRYPYRIITIIYLNANGLSPVLVVIMHVHKYEIKI